MKKILFFLMIGLTTWASAQENLTYQLPPNEIMELADAKPAPVVRMNNQREYMILLYRNMYKTIAELAETEMRLGGLRINPTTNIGSRTTYYNAVQVKSMKNKNAKNIDVKGLPNNLRMANFTWSPDQKKVAFTHTAQNQVELWVLDVEKAEARKISNSKVNANMGDVINWFSDSESLLVKMLPENRKPLIDAANYIPTGPTISVSEGTKAQNRTYQDLLKNASDEHNFEQLATSEIHKVTLNEKQQKWLDADMFRSVSFSPDGNYVLISTIHQPFSYLVPYYRFPTQYTIYNKDAKKIHTVAKVPLNEVLPKGFMAERKGRRDFSWRADKGAVLVFAQALDGGDPAFDTEYRDEVFQLEAPFDGKPQSIVKTKNRFSGIYWGNDNLAVVVDYWWNTRNTKAYAFSPSDNQKQPLVLWDRNYQDTYSSPGNFVTKRNTMGRYVLALNDDNAFLIGAGFSEKGQFPFLDQMNLTSLKKKRLYESEYTDKVENILEYDANQNKLLVRLEAPTEYPNYYFRDLKKNKLQQITHFENPFKSLQNVYKEVITYKREDSIELSATLYLPVGYDKAKKEKKPMILWAYPREFKDKVSASQNTQNPNEFTYPFWASPIYWVTRGYVVLDDAAFPIVGEGDKEPNDSFRTQLVANAKAAIDAVDKMGYIDPNRVAVGGHSYGAFMVANLLSHSNLFAAGIARSGAYNRTLTPFGFQSEERSYWDAPEVYNNMSPFMHADKMKTPLLLIHGQADNNSGTYPMQSERYFNALKGLGAPVRLVMFPKESHSYRAKETILHMLWEQDQWLEKHVKNKK